MKHIHSSELRDKWSDKDSQAVLHYNKVVAVLVPVEVGKLPQRSEVLEAAIEKLKEDWGNDGS